MPVIEGGFGLTSTDSSNIITVQTETAVQIFDNVAVLEQDQFARELNLYGDVVIGSDLKGRFGSFGVPKHLLSNRKNGCTWNPKGKMRMNVNTFDTCAVEYDGEQCPDAFFGTCFERLFGPGNSVRDLYATQEGQMLIAKMLKKLYQGLGNSFFDLMHFANHPMIEDANTGAFYNVSEEEWADYIDQMLSGDCGGLITLMDALAAEGVSNYSPQIPLADINLTTKRYTGDVRALLQSVLENAPAELRSMADTGMMINGTLSYPVYCVTNDVYLALKSYINSIAGTNELAYRYMLERADGTTKLMRNVLMFDGLPVIRWDACARFDAITGAQSTRVALIAPQVLGVLHDVNDLRQWDGQGLIIEQSKRVQDKGKIFMSTTYRWGSGIADPDFISMASRIVHPA